MPNILLSPAATILSTSAGLCVRSDLGTFQLAGADAAAFVEQVAPLCDGTRDRAAIVAALGGYSAHSVTALLDALAARGLIETAPDGARVEERGQEAFFRAWPQAPSGATSRLAEARVLVAGRAPWCATAVEELSAAGVGTVHSADEEAALSTAGSAPWTLLLGARAGAGSTEDAEQTSRLARLAHRAGLVSLWAHLDGTRAFLGPLVTPGQTACIVCATAPTLSPQPSTTPPAPALDPRRAISARLLGHHVAMVALQVLSGYTPAALGGRLVVQDLATLASSLHTLVRLPWCPVCGD